MPAMAASATSTASNMNSKADIVESAIHYITCLQSSLERVQKQLDECQCQQGGQRPEEQ
jgi:hypothetical protein